MICLVHDYVCLLLAKHLCLKVGGRKVITFSTLLLCFLLLERLSTAGQYIQIGPAAAINTVAAINTACLYTPKFPRTKHRVQIHFTALLFLAIFRVNLKVGPETTLSKQKTGNYFRNNGAHNGSWSFGRDMKRSRLSVPFAQFLSKPTLRKLSRNVCLKTSNVATQTLRQLRSDFSTLMRGLRRLPWQQPQSQQVWQQPVRVFSPCSKTYLPPGEGLSTFRISNKL